MLKFSLIILVSLLFLFPGCQPEKEPAVIGVKIYEHPGPYGPLFEQWNDMGINTGFCSEELISDNAFMEEARIHHISTFVIFPVFYDPEALSASPDLAAINRNGEKAAEEWVEFICPSREDYRRRVVGHARQIIREYHPEGISIDFIRHFVYWEKVYPDRDPNTLPVTCFDPVCLANFQRDAGIAVPDSLVTVTQQSDWILEHHEDAWTAWRCHLITSMAQEIARAVREEEPDIMINIHLVPWAKEDFNGAIKRVAGQDIRALSGTCAFLSPMTYAHMVKQPPSWIHHIVEDFFMQTGGKLLPSIQVDKAYLENVFGLEEFRETVEAALQPPSSGVVVWSWERLIAEPAKADLFKDMINAL